MKKYQKNSMKIIATHSGADFDALASLVAAYKLYPGADIMICGVQDQFLDCVAGECSIPAE